MAQLSKLISIVFLTMLISVANLLAQDIHKAIEAGDLNKVKELLEADPDLLEFRGENGNTPLIWACRGADSDRITKVEIANFLIDKGADVNAKGGMGFTALIFVTTSEPDEKYYNLMKRLIDQGADVNASMTVRKWTKIRDAVGSRDIKLAKFLIDNGADINLRDVEGTCLQKLIHGYSATNKKQTLEMAMLFLENGAILQEFSYGNSELHLAAIRGFTDLVPALVKHGADVNAKNDYGHTPLYYAARHGHRKTAEALISAGADKSTIVETNYGIAPQLTETLNKGEAWLWYLNCHTSPRIGYAVKTQNHLLIFNPYNIIESEEAGLANGYLNPRELSDQQITILNCYQTPLSGSQPDILEMAHAMPYANFVLNLQPTDDDSENAEIPRYHQAKANESFSINGVKVHTIPSCKDLFGGDVLGYLVEVDGLKIFHAGLHSSGPRASILEKFKKEIDYLKPFGPIDFAILPIRGRHIDLTYDPYLYLIDQLSPKAIYLIGEELINEEYSEAINVLSQRDVSVSYPDGGVAIGQRFHYPDIFKQPGNQLTFVNKDINLKVSQNAFYDTEDLTVDYSVKLQNGNALPNWLTFNPKTLEFSGTPTKEQIINIALTAKDSDKNIETENFRLTVIKKQETDTNKLDIKSDLVLDLPFTGKAKDNSSHKLKSEVHGATLCKDRNGKEKSAFLFDGKDDYIKVENIKELEVISALTLSCWIKPNAEQSQFAAWLASLYTNEETSRFVFGYGQNPQRLWGLAVHNETWYDHYFRKSIPADVWTHVCVTVNVGISTIKYYVNGELVNTSQLKEHFAFSNGPLVIGYQPDDDRYFSGCIDDVKIYERELNGKEVEALLIE